MPDMTPHECFECGSPIVDGYCSHEDCECSAPRARGPKCNGCGMQLLKKNAWMYDGCPCNTPFGVNDGNQTISEWRRELQQEAMHENERLKNAIRTHRNQKADDRCIEDDDRLYEALGDGIKCDRHVGDQCAMLENCKRFIANRTLGGGWIPYAELEEQLKDARSDLGVASLRLLSATSQRDELAKYIGLLEQRSADKSVMLATIQHAKQWMKENKIPQ